MTSTIQGMPTPIAIQLAKRMQSEAEARKQMDALAKQLGHPPSEESESNE